MAGLGHWGTTAAHMHDFIPLPRMRWAVFEPACYSGIPNYMSAHSIPAAHLAAQRIPLMGHLSNLHRRWPHCSLSRLAKPAPCAQQPTQVPPFCKHSGATTCLESALLSRCSVPTCTSRGRARVLVHGGMTEPKQLSDNLLGTPVNSLAEVLTTLRRLNGPPAHSPPTPAAACPPARQPAPVAAAPRWQRRQQPTADNTRKGGPAKWNNVVTSSGGKARNRQVHLSGYPHKHAACRTMAVHTCCAALACSSL